LGQVHKATTFDGEKLAIKLQYPSIDKTIKSDIKLLKKLSFSKNILRIIKEVEERLYEEIDYENELKNNIETFDRFKKLDVIVPKVYKRFSTKHILATSFIEGDDLYSWLMKNPSKKQKTKIANQMFSLFTHSIFKHKKIQADPNPANFIITKDNRLAMIDFGCMKEFDDEFIKTYKSIFHTYLCEDKEKILTTYKEIGFIKDKKLISDEMFEKKILPFNRWAIEPFLHQKYIFTKEYLDEGVKYAGVWTKKEFVVLRDFVFLDRTIHGLFSLFEKMDAEIDMRVFREYVGFN